MCSMNKISFEDVLEQSSDSSAGKTARSDQIIRFQDVEVMNM